MTEVGFAVELELYMGILKNMAGRKAKKLGKFRWDI